MKIGRNDPCPCGSGKKYKQCCLAKAQKPKGLLGTRTKALSGQVVKSPNGLKQPASQGELKLRPIKAVWVNQPVKPIEPVNLIERTFGEAIAAAGDAPQQPNYPLEEPNVEVDDTQAH